MRNHGRKPRITNLFHKQRGRCYLCRKQMVLREGQENTASLEHRNPESRNIRNFYKQRVKAACWSCNNEKADKTELEYRLSLQGTA